MLQCVPVSGYWKAPGMLPGAMIETHNHAWNAVQISGQWRLLDCAWAAVYNGGSGGSYGFFIPPSSFVHSHLPLDPCWQLLSTPLGAQEFWELPFCHLEFFSEGMKFLPQNSLKKCTVAFPSSEQV